MDSVRPDIQNYKYILLPTFNKINEMFIRLRTHPFMLDLLHFTGKTQKNFEEFLKAFSSGTNKHYDAVKSHTPMRFMQSSTLHSMTQLVSQNVNLLVQKNLMKSFAQLIVISVRLYLTWYFMFKW